MIDFGLKSGDLFALPYAYLVCVHLNGGATIELEFTDWTIWITGRNLGPLFQHLLAQSCRKLEESPSGFDHEERQTSWLKTISLRASALTTSALSRISYTRSHTCTLRRVPVPPSPTLAARSMIPDERLVHIVSLLSPRQLEAARKDIAGRLKVKEQDEFMAQDDRALALALPIQWAPEFRRHLIATYTDNLLVAIDHAVYSQAGQTDDLPSRLAKERGTAGKSRMRAGLIFAGIGTIFILSNLLVLPLMAGAISRTVEHPAAIAIDKLGKFLESATKEGAQPGTKAALDAMRAMSGYVDSLTSTTSQLQLTLSKLKETRPDIEHTDPTTSSQWKTIADAQKQIATKLSQGRKATDPPPPSAEVFAQLLSALNVTADSKASGIIVRDAQYHDVTDQFIMIPKAPVSFGPSLTAVDEALQSLGEHHAYLAARRRIIDTATDRVKELSSDDGKSGLLKTVSTSIASLDQAGRALDELVTTGPELATEAKAATKTLSSVAGFVLPYAFAVLAIGAMLVSIGVTSVLRSLKHSDEKYEDMVELNKTLLLARLAATLHGQGASADALIERLARLGEPSKKGEGGVPLPVARAVAEVAKALKQG